jgi:hypothetical protein
MINHPKRSRRANAAMTADFIESATKIANAHQGAMRGMNGSAALEYVRKVIADNDIVTGIWQEPTAPHGVGIRTIKGQRWLQAIVASGASEKLRVSAIPCVDEEQAVAAERMFGDSKPN